MIDGRARLSKMGFRFLLRTGLLKSQYTTSLSLKNLGLDVATALDLDVDVSVALHCAGP